MSSPGPLAAPAPSAGWRVGVAAGHGGGGLRRLRELWLRGNQIEALPSSMAGLCELRHLDLRENALPELPAVCSGRAGASGYGTRQLRYGSLSLAG
ncbi:leucine-rich repeat domain-containing protein [Streptomyces misionensis]|uniref:leucine-rich repeat domain-containing protein n=1 Tax=Streptomyces misionensis TaxID=67331 RepID=UPI003F4CAE79